MSTPALEPTSKKAWVATIGGLIGAVVPLIAQVAGFLPPPYGAILSGILAVISLITGKATHQVSNAPAGTVLVPQPVGGTYGNPWEAGMTIELGDGLQFNEILEIAKALNVTKLIDPQLRQELLQGADALLTVLHGLQGVPWVLGFLPGDLAGKMDGAVKTVELMKALLEA